MHVPPSDPGMPYVTRPDVACQVSLIGTRMTRLIDGCPDSNPSNDDDDDISRLATISFPFLSF